MEDFKIHNQLIVSQGRYDDGDYVVLKIFFYSYGLYYYKQKIFTSCYFTL